MLPKSDTHRSQNQDPSVLLASPPLSAHVEQAVSEHLGRRWTVEAARDMSAYACHHAAILSNGAYAVFAKFGKADNGVAQFKIELAGLQLLSKLAGVLIPTPIKG